jgi:hypothetical protein
MLLANSTKLRQCVTLFQRTRVQPHWLGKSFKCGALTQFANLDKAKGHGSLPCPSLWLKPFPHLPKRALVLECCVRGNSVAKHGSNRAAGSYCGVRHLRFNHGITGGAEDIVSRAVHNVGFRAHCEIRYAAAY